jgi:transcriptional regulator of acetoin/glycerol metabolism
MEKQMDHDSSELAVGQRHTVERLRAPERRIEARRRDDVPPHLETPEAMTLAIVAFREAKARAIAEFESAYLRNMLRRAEGNVSLAARLSGKERSRFNRLLRKHRIVASEFRPTQG